jgi:chlorobactene glucosyltransferase
VLPLSIVLAVSVAFLIVRAVRQRGALTRLGIATARRPEALARVAVIVPARDEIANIGRCLASLVTQDHQQLAIVVIDDHSTDGTADTVRTFARTDGRIVPLKSPPLPPRWSGKVNACAAAARFVGRAADWLCFLDADMVCKPRLISSAVAAATRGNIDLLTLAPRQELGSFAERLILPCGLYLLSFAQDLIKVQARDSNDAAATGQFMLIRREVYEDVGGHAAVSHSIIEDVELARLIKRRGHHVLMQDGTALLATRMYAGWSTLWPGIAKNLVDMLGGPLRTLMTVAIAVTLSWAIVVLPILDASFCIADCGHACVALVPALAGSAAAFGLHIAGAAFFRIPLYYGLFFPLGYSIGALIALDSVRWRFTRRVRWKGRVYR